MDKAKTVRGEQCHATEDLQEYLRRFMPDQCLEEVWLLLAEPLTEILAQVRAEASQEKDAEIAELEGESRVLIGCPCWCHTGDGPEPHRDCRECVRGTATPNAIDRDHTEALWQEKWKAALDLMGGQAGRAAAAEAERDALRATELPQGWLAAPKTEWDTLREENARLRGQYDILRDDAVAVWLAAKRLLTPEQCATLGDEDETAFGRMEDVAAEALLDHEPAPEKEGTK